MQLYTSGEKLVRFEKSFYTEFLFDFVIAKIDPRSIFTCTACETYLNHFKDAK